MERGAKKIQVLVVDDSALMRREIRKILEEDPEIEVVGAARNGEEGLSLCKELQPDVVTMDINMPVMDGLTALQCIMMESPRPVVMLSSLTQDGAITTYEALELGAVDFVPKPGGTVSVKISDEASMIIATVKAAAKARVGGRRSSRNSSKKKKAAPRAEVATPPKTVAASDLPGILVFGQSTGGPNAILEVLPHLPADLGLPVFVIQHMPGTFTPSFAQRLGLNSSFPFREIQNGDLLLPNHGYLAPGDIHSRLVSKPGAREQAMFQLSRYPTDTAHSPSVGVGMESCLEMFGDRIIAVMLTGMGDDGADAMVKIKNAGGRTIAEDESTAIVFGMPKEAIRRGGAEFVLPVQQIAEKIIELAAGLKGSLRVEKTTEKKKRFA